MKLLQSILVAVDFDDTSNLLLSAARMIAMQFGAQLHLAHVFEPHDQVAQAGEPLRLVIINRLEEIRTGLISEGVAVAPVLYLEGRGPIAIVAAAERREVNLIMLGARGVSADHLLPLGTTTEKVMRRSVKPVLAVHPGRPLQISRILCPVDFSASSRRGLENAIRLARAFHAKLEVFTVMPLPSKYHRLDYHWSQWAYSAEAAAATQYTREFDEFLTGFEFHDVDWHKSIARGHAAQEIVARVQSTNTDLIVMGSVGRTGLPYAFMGSTAVKVARQIPCSLLTVKEEQVLIAKLEQNIDDINAAFAEGRELIDQGFYNEALDRFDRCLALDPYFAHAFDAKAQVHERMRRPQLAEQCRKQAEIIRHRLWDQQATASVRAHHPLLGRTRELT